MPLYQIFVLHFSSMADIVFQLIEFVNHSRPLIITIWYFMSQVLAHLERFVLQHPGVERWFVAYSGGLDSSVLLHAMAKLDLKVPLEAVHVNHGLSDHAGSWSQHCRAVCASLSVTCHSPSVEVIARGRGLEDAAREARYRVFEDRLGVKDGLLLAHHCDDQAETLMLRLMRGSGTRGLSAMAASRPLGKAHLYRPLLDLTREDLKRQAQAWGIAWVEDQSNSSTEFDRNFLRLKVFPELSQRWPTLSQQWSQSAQWCRQADDLVTEVAAEDLARSCPQPERLGHSVDLAVLEEVSAYRRGNALRLWFEQLGVALPDKAQLDTLDQQFVKVRPDSAAEVRWGQVAIRHFKQRLFCLPVDMLDQPPADASSLEVAGWMGDSIAWGKGSIFLESVAEGGFTIPPQGFDLSLRRPGERCHPSWRDRSQTLKKLLQESGLEPWLRDQMPCLRVSDELAVAADLWHCKGAQADDGYGYRLCWRLTPQ